MKRINKFYKKLKKITKEFRSFLLFLILLALLFDSIFIKINSDLIIFGILAIYIFIYIATPSNSKITFIYSFVMLFTMFLSYIVSGTSFSTEKAAVWCFLFLLLGVIQQWKE